MNRVKYVETTQGKSEWHTGNEQEKRLLKRYVLSGETSERIEFFIFVRIVNGKIHFDATV